MFNTGKYHFARFHYPRIYFSIKSVINIRSTAKFYSLYNLRRTFPRIIRERSAGDKLSIKISGVSLTLK